MSLIELTFVRHGETEKNIRGILQGRLDIPLNERGLQEAEELSQCLRWLKFDVIFSSDLRRAVQCANKIAKYFPSAEYIKEPLLRERFFGEHQNKKLTDVGYENLEYITMVKHLYECKCPKGETNKEVIERIKIFINACLGSCHGKKVLVVTHGGIIMLALNYIFDEVPKFRNRRIHSNGFVSYIKINEKLEVFDSLINVSCKSLMERNR